MREFAKSILSFSWAMSLFGIKQLGNILTVEEPSQSTGKAAAFDSIIYATEAQFGDVTRGVFEAGDKMQRGMVDLMWSGLTLEALNPTEMIRMTTESMQQSAEAFMRAMQRDSGSQREPSGWGYLLSPGGALEAILRIAAWIISTFSVPGEDSGVAWQEFKNKFQVFGLVARVDSVLGLPPPGPYIPLAELVEKAYALEPYSALWAVEGVGSYYSESFWERNEVPRNLLTDERVSTLPSKSLTMLHAGMGLSFGKRLLKTVNPQSPVSEIRKVLQQLVTLCKESSREGYLGAAIESLGLVTRELYPQMVQIIDQQLPKSDTQLVGYFWHGVGRAIYFSPGNFLPSCSSSWRAIEECREAPHELGRLNALAGLTWGMTLVNLRRPEIMETLLKRHGDRLSESGAFCNGVISSIIMRYDTTPEDPEIAAFCQYQPDPRLVELWNSQVKNPCQHALQEYYPVLKEHNRLEEVFRYQSLTELVERLKREPTRRRLSHPSSERETATL
jgi:hypothetical protein